MQDRDEVHRRVHPRPHSALLVGAACDCREYEILLFDLHEDCDLHCRGNSILLIDGDDLSRNGRRSGLPRGTHPFGLVHRGGTDGDESEKGDRGLGRSGPASE